MKKLFTTIFSAVSIFMPVTTLAQTYPTKPVRMVVGFPPGGGTDAIARLLAPKLGEHLGQNVIIDNRPGANSNIGIEHVAKAVADGYTLLVSTNAIAINMSLYKNVRYDAVKDFTAISMLSSSPLLLAVHPSLPVKSVGELIKFARARPGELNYSSSGGPQYLTAELMKIKTKTSIVHVPFSGSGPSITALISGEVQMTISNMPTLLPHVTSGRLRPLSVASAARNSLMPKVPTMKEEGVDMEAAVWYGLFVPSPTPREIISKLADATVAAVGTPDFKSKLLKLGAEPVGSRPNEFGKQVAHEVGQWAEVVKISGAKPD